MASSGDSSTMSDSISSLTDSTTDTVISSTEADSLTTLSFSSASSNTRDRNPARAQREARAAVLASLESAGSSHAAQLQQRATDIHLQSKTIQQQERDLAKNTKALAKETKLLQREADRAVTAMKELGDVENWANMMEQDFLVLEETMRLVDEDRLKQAETADRTGLPVTGTSQAKSWLW